MRAPGSSSLEESSGLGRNRAERAVDGAAAPGPELELLELQQGEAPHRGCEQDLGCRGCVLPGRRGENAGLAPSGSRQAPRLLSRLKEQTQAVKVQTHRAPTSRTFAVGSITAFCAGLEVTEM